MNSKYHFDTIIITKIIKYIQLHFHAFLQYVGFPLMASFVSDHRVRAGTAGLNLQLHPHVTYLLLRSQSPQESVTVNLVTISRPIRDTNSTKDTFFHVNKQWLIVLDFCI